jgi:hypothetical protein
MTQLLSMLSLAEWAILATLTDLEDIRRSSMRSTKRYYPSAEVLLISEDVKWISEGWEIYRHSEKDAVKEGTIKNFKVAIGGNVTITREGQARWALIYLSATVC